LTARCPVAPQVVLQQQGKRVQQDKGAPCPIRSDAIQPLSPTQRRPSSPGMLPSAVVLCETASGLDGFVSNKFAPCPNQPASNILRRPWVQCFVLHPLRGFSVVFTAKTRPHGEHAEGKRLQLARARSGC
jgi:hypothetical protein